MLSVLCVSFQEIFFLLFFFGRKTTATGQTQNKNCIRSVLATNVLDLFSFSLRFHTKKKKSILHRMYARCGARILLMCSKMDNIMKTITTVCSFLLLKKKKHTAIKEHKERDQCFGMCT